MAQNTQRIFIIVIVGVFLLSTIAFTGIVIYSVVADNSNDSTAEIDPAEFADEFNEFDEDREMLQGTSLSDFEPIAGDVSEIEVVDLVEGDGAEVQPGDTVVAHYTGAYAVNGEIFESSRDSGEPAVFPLDSLIAGWQEGIPGMKEGGTRRLIIPGELAYGEAPDGYSPGDGGRPLGTLVFDIELFGVQ